MYIIAGCNGAGKTTAAYNLLPDTLNCREFVNADEIARGISPFQPEKATYEAGRILLQRISSLIDRGEDFTVETTLAALVYKDIILKAQSNGYRVNLLFFWLNSAALAKERVRLRVNQIPYDYTVEVRNRFKGLDLIECLMNYGMRFVTLYRDRDQANPHGKEMQKSKMAVWGGLTNSCEKKRSEKQRRKGTI